MYNQPKPRVGTGRVARLLAWLSFVGVTVAAIAVSSVVAVRALDSDDGIAVAAEAPDDTTATSGPATSEPTGSSSTSAGAGDEDEGSGPTTTGEDGKGPCAEDAGVDRCVPVDPGESGSTTIPASSGESGSMDDPLALGTLADVGPWEVSITGFDPDATDEVLAEDSRNAFPVNGAYVLVTVSATHTGPGERSAFETLAVDLVGDDGQVYTDIGCSAFAPDDMFFEPDATTGETVEGTFCLDAPAPSVPALVALRSLTAFGTTSVWYSAR